MLLNINFKIISIFVLAISTPNHATLEGWISGGEKATIEEVPYQVQLVFKI